LFQKISFCLCIYTDCSDFGKAIVRSSGAVLKQKITDIYNINIYNIICWFVRWCSQFTDAVT